MEALVGFVEDGENGFFFGDEFFHPSTVFVLRRRGGVEEEKDEVGAGDEVSRGFIEDGAEGVRRLTDAGGVEKDDLEFRFGQDSADGASGGLGDAGDDGNGFAEEGVEQGGFSGVGASDDDGDAGAEIGEGGRGVGHGASPAEGRSMANGEKSTTCPLTGRWARMPMDSMSAAKESRWSCSPCTKKTSLGLALRT